MSTRAVTFHEDEVRAALAGRKSQFRYPVDLGQANPDLCGPVYFADESDRARCGLYIPAHGTVVCPYTIGDRLWVQETWQDYCPMWNGHWCGHGTQEGIERDHTPVYRANDNWIEPSQWRTPDSMPRWASRLELAVTAMRVERLHELGIEGARAEGIDLPRCGCEVCMRAPVLCPADATSHIDAFVQRWLAAGLDWNSNPWVFVVSFQTHRHPAR